MSNIKLEPSGKTVTVSNLTVTSAEFFALVSKQPETKREQFVLDIIAVGSAAMQRVQSTIDVDFVDKRFGALSATFEKALATFEKQATESLTKRFSPTESGSYTKHITELVASARKDFQGWTSQIEKNAKDLFDPDKKTSAVGRLQQLLEDATEQFEQMFDPDVKGSYAHRLNQQLECVFGGNGRAGVLGDSLKQALQPVMKDLQELKEKVEVKKAAEQIIAVTPLKGFEFENQVEKRLADLARPYGDSVQSVGTGPGGAKTGDFVVELNGLNRRITVEARAQKVSGPTIKQDLKRAMEARSADFGILVVPSAHYVPDYIGRFQVYDHQILTDADGLDAAFRTARVILRMDSVSADEVDLPAIRARLERIKEAVAKERNIRTNVTKIESAADGIRTEAVAISKTIMDLVIEIESLLRSDDQQATAA